MYIFIFFPFFSQQTLLVNLYQHFAQNVVVLNFFTQKPHRYKIIGSREEMFILNITLYYLNIENC